MGYCSIELHAENPADLCRLFLGVDTRRVLFVRVGVCHGHFSSSEISEEPLLFAFMAEQEAIV